MAVPMTTAPQSKIEAPWEDCPTSTLAPPTATVPTKATAHACPNDRCCQSALANRKAKATQATARANGESTPKAEAATTTTDKATAIAQRPNTMVARAFAGAGAVPFLLEAPDWLF